MNSESVAILRAAPIMVVNKIGRRKQPKGRRTRAGVGLAVVVGGCHD
jgi:hypothetical protein